MSEMWNLWHGCHKKSEGCQHCYVFRRDAEFEKDSNVVTKTASFNLPIRHKAIICEPLLGPIDFHGMLAPLAYAASPMNGDAQRCEQVTVGGESGRDARVCDYDWVLDIRQQCIDANDPSTSSRQMPCSAKMAVFSGFREISRCSKPQKAHLLFSRFGFIAFISLKSCL